MFFNIILWASIIWVAPLIYFMLANETKFKKNIAVGVTIPLEGREDKEVVDRLLRFKKELKIVCLILTLIAIPCIFITNIYTSLALWGLWLDLCIVVPYIPYVRCNKDLKEIKKNRQWKKESKESIILPKSPTIKWLSPLVFIPSLVISLLPLIWDRYLFVAYLINAVSIILFWIFYRYMYRNKAEVVDDNVELTTLLTQVRKHNWGILWLVSAYGMSLLSLSIGLTQKYPYAMLFAILIISTVIVVASLRIEFKTRRVQEELTKESGQILYVDEDDAWIGGILYYNPKDRRLFVNYRVGTNMTINMARPAGKVVTGLLILTLLAMPLIGPFMGQMGKKPIELTLTETHITAVNGRTKYSIPLEDIEYVELLDSLPERFSRTNGTSLENLQKGTFTAKGIPTMKVMLDPNHSPYIFITTKDNKKYLFGSRDTEHTQSIYDELSRILQAALIP